MQWLEQASPQEIGEALLAVDEQKAYEVAAYLGARLPPELARMLESAIHGLERNPVRTIGGALFAGLKGASR
jgi:hypothetical protein